MCELRFDKQNLTHLRNTSAFGLENKLDYEVLMNLPGPYVLQSFQNSNAVKNRFVPGVISMHSEISSWRSPKGGAVLS